MAGTSRDELAAAIARLEASGTTPSPAPRRRSAAGRPGAAEEAASPARVVDATEPAAAAPQPALPERDVNDARGPALVSLEGQAAHDEALGVAPDGSELAAPRAPRKKREPQAELAFADATPHQRAIDLGYKLVSRREHTVQQVRDKLAAKDCEPAAIDEAVAELTRYGFLDDQRYARLFAEDKRRLQGWGAMRIRMKLARDGISRAMLDELFADDEAALDAPSELEAALALLHRKQPDLNDPKVKARMAGMLARRGINGATVWQALREHERAE